MDSMNIIVAKNIKRLREEEKLSMNELVKLSGVSESMLTQVEWGDGNPIISTLWKISNGMKAPFDTSTVRPKSPYEIVKKTEIQPLLEGDGKVKNFSLFPDNENRRFAVYYLELDQGSYRESEPHLKGTTEFITVFKGKIEIYADGQRSMVEGGKSMRFRADTNHSYKNVGNESAILHMVPFNP